MFSSSIILPQELILTKF